jgi:energy-converting hydrogenase Eha subunit A
MDSGERIEAAMERRVIALSLTASLTGASRLLGALACLVPVLAQVTAARAQEVDTWITRTPAARYDLGVGVVDGVVYAVGGFSNYGGRTLAIVEAMDPATETWTVKAPVPTPRNSGGVGVVDGVLYVIGGGNPMPSRITESYDPVTNTWRTRAPMPTPRYTVRVGVVGGLLFAVGGQNSSGFLSTVEAFDPATGTWTTKAPMPTARDDFGVGVVAGVLYAVGGWNGGNPLSTVEAYDPATNSWTTKAPMPTPRSGLGVGVVQGILYAIGGTGSAGPIVQAYDPATNSWTTKAPMPTPRSDFGVAVVNDAVYAIAGRHDGWETARVEKYDPAANSWTTGGAMPTPRSALGVAVLGDLAYGAGGQTRRPVTSGPGNEPVATLEAYDPVENAWVTKAPMPTPRSALAVGVASGVLFAIGGDNGGPLRTVEAYDPVTNTWAPKAPMPTARSGLAVGVIDGVLYAVGGQSTGPVATLEAYDPATNTWTTKAPMPTPRSGLGVGVIGGELYAVGGFAGADLGVVESYDPITNTWTTRAPMPTPRSWLAVGVLNRVLYAVGGAFGGVVEIYDPFRYGGQACGLRCAGTWIAGPPLPTWRSGLGIGVTGSAMHAIGGDYAGALLSTVETLLVEDHDEDGLPDTWERHWGLDPESAVGDDGAGGDPDQDGLTNADERAAGTHPRGFHTRYLAEGATSTFFDMRLALLNPGGMARALLQFQKTDGTTSSLPVTIPAHSRATLDARTLPALATAEFSTVLESDVALVMDRVMAWDTVNGYGAHAETAVAAPAPIWYLAEGATHSGFNLFYLLQNPNPAVANVRVRYLRPAGAPLEKTYALPPTSRTNLWVNLEEFAGLGQALGATDVSAVVQSTNDQPIIVERAMYLDLPGQAFGAGHESAGVTAPAAEWFLAEGATGSFFDLFVLVANPGDTDAQIEATYLLPDGSTIVKRYAVEANSRFTVWVDHEDARLADTAVSTTIRSTGGVPVIVERAMWWPGSFGQWYEAHNSPGATTTGTRWAVANGEVGGPRGVDTYILVANTSPAPGTVTVTLLFEDGTSVARVFTIAGHSRFNVDVRHEFGGAALDKRFGTLVESQGETPAQIVVEGAMYWDALGQRWAAGVNALATVVP